MVPLPIPSFCSVTAKTGTSTTSKSTGGPGVRLMPERVPPKILRRGVAALNAETTMVRFGPVGAWILTGITAPLLGFEIEIVVLAGTDMPGPEISTCMLDISSTDCADAKLALGNSPWIHATRRDEIEKFCACRAWVTNDKLTATVGATWPSSPHAQSDAMSNRRSGN